MRPTLLALMLLAAAVSACSLIYKPEVQQGTLLSTEMLGNLKPGMTMRQVRLLLGSPSISDSFHPERWDYVYSIGRVGDKLTPTHLTLFFRNDVLERASGDLAPAALTNAAGSNGAAAAGSTGKH